MIRSTFLTRPGAQASATRNGVSTAKLLVLVAMILIGILVRSVGRAETHSTCTVGIYAGPEDGFVILTRSESGFRYAFDTGIVGAVGSPEARVSCLNDAVAVDGAQTWSRVPLRQTDTAFQSQGVALAGRLIEAPEADGQGPLVVFAHGSEQTGWLDRAGDPYQLVGRGISVFVYDKRGTGRSGGAYNQNFPLLADDLVAASQEARRLAGDRYGRFGIIGLSQGGWVAPLAANRAEADFIAVGYGLVMDIREEDAAQVALELREAGYGDDVIALARQITDATARVATETSPASVMAFDAVRNRFADAPWLKVVRGDFTGLLLDARVAEIETAILPVFRSYEVDWSVDPVATVRAVEVPQLWVFAGEDRAAPPNVSIARLTALRDAGQDITLRVFPETDHGIWQFSVSPDGTRRYTQIAPGYYDMLADWAHGLLQGMYGTAEIR
ncbi:MAG: alpha/beta hydrolase [Pseudomonadota bacterium]